MQKITLFEIYKIFFLIGIQLLGGGYVILPLLQKYLVEERKWLSEEELIDYFAVSQCIPGIIAGNIAMFSGYKARKSLGALTAIIGLIIVTVKEMWSKSVNSKFTYILFFIILLLLLLLPVSPAIIIIISALTAFLYSKIGEKKNA